MQIYGTGLAPLAILLSARLDMAVMSAGSTM